jgi:hypothetical protein
MQLTRLRWLDRADPSMVEAMRSSQLSIRMAHCPSCGGDNPEHRVTCWRCGQWIERPQDPSATPVALQIPCTPSPDREMPDPDPMEADEDLQVRG